MITVKELYKYYGDEDEIKAVDGASFTCPDGQITGLLGPNGAGKTTTLRMIAGLIQPKSGTVIVDDVDVVRDPSAARRILGVQSDMTGVYPRLTPREQFRYYGRFYGLRGETLEAHVDAIIKELKMEALADRRAEGFSRGERQKVVLGRSLVHNPPNIMLDEPTQGLDVMSTRAMRQVIRQLRQAGHTILFSSHIMQEVATLCDNIVVIAQGQVVAQGSPDALRQQTGMSDLEDAFVSIIGSGEGLK